MNLFIVLITCLTSIVIGYFVGFANGFNKCKEIDNNILKELTNKYKKQLEKIS